MKRAIVSLSLLFMVLISRSSVAQVAITVSFGPPPLPVYAQPPCPEDGYLWTPGYWAYDNYFGYYWVPGTWVLAPQPGLLWTPGWWGWSEGAFLFHEGFWAPHVGFYGGINYGFGFFGDGYAGGRWDGNHFYYNRAVSNINVTNIHNIYNTTIVNNVTNHISYNGGNGGVVARPTHEQEEIAQQHHVAPQPAQLRHQQMARANPQLRAEVNHGKPPVAATARPAEFTGSHVVAAREAGGAYQAPERKLDHAGSVPPHQAPLPLERAKSAQPGPHEPKPSRQDRQQEHQQQQERVLVDRQNQQHAQLQAQQQREHEHAQQTNLSEERQQQMEQRHAQQTAQMEQEHMQQMQNVQRPQAGNRPSEPGHSEAKPPHR
jgi:hypothetical protein